MVIGTEGYSEQPRLRESSAVPRSEATEKACPLFVPLVEEGWTDIRSEQAVAEQVARIYLDQAFTGDFKSADVLVLGCTHYPLLKPLLHRLVPEHVTIVDSADSTAQRGQPVAPQGLPKLLPMKNVAERLA